MNNGLIGRHCKLIDDDKIYEIVDCKYDQAWYVLLLNDYGNVLEKELRYIVVMQTGS